MKKIRSKSGFTLLEILVAMTITGMIIAAGAMVFSSLQSASTEVDQRTNLSSNARGAMFFIEDNIKMMGFNPMKDMSKDKIMEIATPGVLQFVRNDLVQGNADVQIKIGLKSTDDDNPLDGKADADTSGATSLVINGGNVTDDVVAIGFAYGFDDNADGDVDTDSASGQIIWAVDTDSDGFLDRSLDTNFDGLFDAVDAAAPVASISPVSISKIRAVKIWLLVRTKHPIRNETDSNTYYVGATTYTPNNAYGHVLHTTSTRCRNMF